MNEWIEKYSIKFFGKYGTRYTDHFKELKPELGKAKINILLSTYLSITFFLTTSFFLLTFFISLLIFFLLFRSVFFIDSFFLALFFSSGVFLILYFYPKWKRKRREEAINAALPFLLSHMSAAAASGLPPHLIFKLVSSFKEYGEAKEELKDIIYSIDAFGKNLVAGIRHSMKNIASSKLRDFLFGFISTIESGGNLQNYLHLQAEKSIFEYRLSKEKYLRKLSVYADIYTVAIAAGPLFLIIILIVMSILGEKIFGLGMPVFIRYIIYPLVIGINLCFLSILQLTRERII